MRASHRGHQSLDVDRTEASRPRMVFAAAFALMVLDFADRQVVVATFPALQNEWGLSDAQLGALVSVVSVTVGLGAFPAALLVDRWSRVRAIALMGTVWSLAAAAAGAAQSFGQLLTARAALGAGEAGYGPAAGALLATRFPPARRATVLGAFQAAAPLGGALGVLLGGVIAARWGWRAALWVFVPPGLAVALLFLRVRDYPTVRLDAATGARTAGGVLRELFRARSGSAGYIGSAVQLVVVSTIYTWLPSQLHRAYGLPVDRSAAATALVILAGFAGMIGFAHLADRASCAKPAGSAPGTRRTGGAHRRPARHRVRRRRSRSGPVPPDPHRRRYHDGRRRPGVGRGGRRRASRAARDGHLDPRQWYRTSSGSRSALSSLVGSRTGTALPLRSPCCRCCVSCPPRCSGTGPGSTSATAPASSDRHPARHSSPSRNDPRSPRSPRSSLPEGPMPREREAREMLQIPEAKIATTIRVGSGRRPRTCPTGG